MKTALCIWCSRPASDRDAEHIFPEALGCPDHLVLPGTVVCRNCNTGLAHLDQAVADEFDLVAFLKRIPRKGGRPPEIVSRGNMFARIETTGPEIFFNLEPFAVTSPKGRKLAPYRGGLRDIRPNIRRNGPVGHVSFDQPFGQGKKFVRGITKIAFSAFTFLCGADLARSSRFDGVRTYVRHGGTKRHTMIRPAPDDTYTLAAHPPWSGPDGEYCIEIRIDTIQFLVDLSTSESLFPTLKAKALETYGPDGWSILPNGV